MPPEQKTSKPGWPADAELFAIEKMESMNTKAARQSIDDQEFSWLENWFPIGPGNLRTMYGKGPNIYTASGVLTIVVPFFYNIAATQYAVVFLSDGTAYQVNTVTHAVTTISAVPGTFYNGGDLPAAQQFGNSGIVIVTTATVNGYYAWDGTLYSPGGPAPLWLSGLSAPIAITGNTNTSNTLTNLSDTSQLVIGQTITSSAGDIPAGTTVASIVSGTSITISQAATGSNTGVTFTVNWSMPTGIQGTAVEIYQSRVWVDNGDNRYTSSPGNGATFAASDGGTTTTSKDAFLKIRYTQIRQSSGFLYQFADSSINSLSNVQTTGSPPSTTFNDLNVDPQVGTPWPATVTEFGEGLMLANTSGIYILFGGTARKISDKMDGFFSDATLPLTGTAVPSGAVATIFGIKVYIILIPGAVDYLGVSRPIMIIWNGKKFFVGSQEVNLSYVTTQEVQSQLNSWATDGKNLFQIFVSPSAALEKIAQGKLWTGESYIALKKAAAAYLQLQDNSGAGAIINVEVDTQSSSTNVSFNTDNEIAFVNASGGVIQFQNASHGNINFTVPADSVLRENVDLGGNLLGFTMTSMAKDATLVSAALRYRTETWL